MEIYRKKIRVYGIVQGVGFRPTVTRHAHTADIYGTVSNKGPYVEIEAEGLHSNIERFIELIKIEPPKRAMILKVLEYPWEKVKIRKYHSFEIIKSKKKKGEIFISPDIGICDECEKELYDKNNRRYLHPFINCTCCGPRLTILENLPYDRERTSMKSFPMCPQCESEYEDIKSRRFDAQPVCCNECGPEVYTLDGRYKGIDAIRHIREVIISGGISAIKGIGGFHLCCDATNEEAIKKLRSLKNRGNKPFAVMVKDIKTLKKYCDIDKSSEKIVSGFEKPIVLFPKKHGKTIEALAPNNPYLGVMLPYAPLQLLLFRSDDELDEKMPDILVMTSANLKGAAIARTDDDIEREIKSITDEVLSNNREIRIRADDSVMSIYKNKPYMIRRSRGYAPFPILVSEELKGSVLAIGGELKNTFCFGINNLFYPSSYVGDLRDIRTVNAFYESLDILEKLLEQKPKVLVCDKHPLYNSVEIAEKLSDKYNLPLLKIQHHYAHILSCMAENDFSKRCLGLAFDGTGYGDDGSIWGGELILADTKDFKRISSIDPFIQLGGDKSSREGWRIAISIIYEHFGDKAWNIVDKLKLSDMKTFKVQKFMFENQINAVLSTSLGRIFDAVSAILGIKRESGFEGEAAMALEFKAEEYMKSSKDGFIEEIDLLLDEFNEFIEGKSQNINTKRLFLFILRKRLEGIDIALLAYFFHRALVEISVKVVEKYAKEYSEYNISLSGGVFQNLLLLDMMSEKLKERGFRVLRHSMIAPNDGGIALGQAFYGMHYMERR